VARVAVVAGGSNTRQHALRPAPAHAASTKFRRGSPAGGGELPKSSPRARGSTQRCRRSSGCPKRSRRSPLHAYGDVISRATDGRRSVAPPGRRAPLWSLVPSARRQCRFARDATATGRLTRLSRRMGRRSRPRSRCHRKGRTPVEGMFPGCGSRTGELSSRGSDGSL
jgi:hypothetical protein